MKSLGNESSQISICVEIHSQNSRSRGAFFLAQLQFSFKQLSATTISRRDANRMPTEIQTTVDRLDKPSAYYQGRVSHPLTSISIITML